MAIHIYFAILLGTSLLGQTAESPPAFEAASLKLNTSGGAYYFNGTPGRLEIRHVSLRTLIMMAYHVSDYSLSGPGWLNSIMVDLVAKFPADESPANEMLMLQGLLVDRFKLEVHQEVKDLPGYALVIAPGGPKIHRGEAATRIRRLRRGLIAGPSVPLTQLVSVLQGALQRPVHDTTGLSGNYELSLTWTPDQLGPPGGESNAAAPDDQGPSIFTAVQEQLGLKLEPRKIPTNCVFVDHVERVPTEN